MTDIKCAVVYRPEDMDPPPLRTDIEGYELALYMGGADVLLYERFGSYQGDWWALVAYQGKLGWITGSYGSCSGCDAFDGEFGCFIPGDDDESLRARELAAFGKGYLDDMLDQEAAEKKAAENIEWDLEAEAMVTFIKDGRATAGAYRFAGIS